MQQYNNEAEIVSALINDGGFNFKERGKYLQEGECPNCGEKEVFVAMDKPYVLKCNRLNNCGYTESTRDIYPELYNNFSERYPTTEKDPNATAKAYMELNRHFPTDKIGAWYEQGHYKIPDTKSWCDTVRFYLDEGRTRWWERLIDQQKKDGQRINFGGKRKADGTLVKGDWWTPPGQVIEEGDHVYLVEGIFHAIAFHLSGYKSAALLMAGNYPKEAVKPYLGKEITWWLALDDDKAGRDYMSRHRKKLQKLGEACDIILSGDKKRDWDDLYRLNKLNDYLLKEAAYLGKLFTAKSIDEKSYIYYCKRKSANTVLDFGNRLYNIKVNVKDLLGTLDGADVESEDGKDAFKKHTTINPISNCVPTFLYVERDQMTRELGYFFNIEFCNGSKSTQERFDPSALESPANLNKALIHKAAGASFDGSPVNMRIIKDRWFNEKPIEVTALSYVGYDIESQFYVFKDHAYYKGKELKMNEYGFFEHGKIKIKSSEGSVKIYRGKEFDPDWINNFYKLFKETGIVALAFWTGSLFVTQIKQKLESWPFLEITGEPGAGKSSILDILWKLLGREHYEGVDPARMSSTGRARALAQGSNIPFVLVESDRDSDGDIRNKKNQFDWNEMKTLYGLGGVLRTVGVKTSGNETRDLIFQGSLVITQNATVDSSPAVLERILHLHMTKAHKQSELKSLAQAMRAQETETLAGYLTLCLKNEETILKAFFDNYPIYSETLAKYPEIDNDRVQHNHAQMMAMVKALQIVFPNVDDAILKSAMKYLKDRAIDRCKRLESDHPIVAGFWETYELLNDGGATPRLNHSKDKSKISINLKHFNQVCAEQRVEMTPTSDLKKVLMGSRRYQYLDQGAVRSEMTGRSVWCWQFKTPVDGAK